MDNGRAKANKTGGNLENFVEQALISVNYIDFQKIYIKKTKFIRCKDVMSGKWFCKQYHIGNTIYKTKRVCDFIIFDYNKFKNFLMIECKWKGGAGSVDEKYPYLVCNIIKTKIDTVIVLDGGGYKKEAFLWLKEQVTISTDLIKEVLSMTEFQEKINNGFF